ncbi:MAG: hypothetical protein P4L76_02340 [Beijerinckiaceae bacterium]|nr:hypothetical protein [Beijerinckiaceae bacterium]
MVRTQDLWEEWVLYMLDAVAETAQTTLALVEGVRGQMAGVKKRLRAELPNLYSQDLLNNLFRHPYTRIEFVVNDLGVSFPEIRGRNRYRQSWRIAEDRSQSKLIISAATLAWSFNHAEFR